MALQLTPSLASSVFPSIPNNCGRICYAEPYGLIFDPALPYTIFATNSNISFSVMQRLVRFARYRDLVVWQLSPSLL